MALFKPSAIVGAVSGQVGGVVFRQGKNGTTIARARTHRPASTSFTVNAVNDFHTYIAGWRGMTDEMRLAWRQMAGQLSTSNRLGQKRPWSGFRLYLNWARYAAGPGVNLSWWPPIRANRLALDTIVPNFQTYAYNVGVGLVDGYATGSLFFSGCRACSTTGFRSKNWRFISQRTVSSTYAQYNIKTAWSAALGELSSGELVYLKVVYHRPGWLPSPPYFCSASVG